MDAQSQWQESFEEYIGVDIEVERKYFEASVKGKASCKGFQLNKGNRLLGNIFFSVEKLSFI